MFKKEQKEIEKKIVAYLSKNEISLSGSLKWAHIPFSGEWGTSTSFFQIAADEARSGKNVIVPKRAQELAEGAKEYLGSLDGISRQEAVNGYLNLYYDSSEFSRRVVDAAIEEGPEFGKGEDKQERVMVEFSQPNTHKAMHVGHLRNMMLGAALSNIIEFAGYEVVRSNYIGDYGKDVIKWIWNYRKNHTGETKPENDVTKWMGDMYAESTKNLADDPDGESEILEMFSQWENRDEEIYGLWEETRQWSLDGFFEIYDQLGIHFDELYFESQMEEPAKKEVDQLIKSGLATDEREKDGPVIVNLDKLLNLDNETFRVLVLLRSDGTSLYGAWDLALAKQKFRDYKLDRSIYVVDVRQSLHFTQVFKTLELAGFKEIEKAYHLPYEIVNLPGNLTMSSREGIIVLLETFIREAVDRAYEVSKERNPEMDDKMRKEVANAVGIGAIKYPLLARDNTKIATFDWETALDFNGHAAPYIQYAYVRCNSLLGKTDGTLPSSANPKHKLEEKEIQLIEVISKWPGAVQRAANEYKTLHITNHAYELAKAFNEFYNACHVLKAEPEIRDSRLRLVASAREAIANSLRLLGIDVPQKM